MRSLEQIERDVQTTAKEVAEIHPVQLAIWRQMSVAEKLLRISDMAGAVRQMALATARTQNPDLPPREIHRRALLHYLRVSEWETDQVARFHAFLDRWLEENYP